MSRINPEIAQYVFLNTRRKSMPKINLWKILNKFNILIGKVKSLEQLH